MDFTDYKHSFNKANVQIKSKFKKNTGFGCRGFRYGILALCDRLVGSIGVECSGKDFASALAAGHCAWPARPQVQR